MRTSMDWRISILPIFGVIAVGIIGTVFVFSILYNVAMDQEREWLKEIAQSRARMIESVAQFDAAYSTDFKGGAKAATLFQLVQAHRNFRGFGETGEFTVAEKQGDQIIFVLAHRHFDLDLPKPVPIDSINAEPMRQALAGKSGTIIGLDYRGVKVLAAYEPVKIMNFGIVAKVDISEIQRPFIHAGVLVFLITASLIGLTVVAIQKMTLPLLSEIVTSREDTEKAEAALRESEEKYRTLYSTANVGIALCKMDGTLLEVNHAYCDLLDYPENEALRLSYWDLTPREYEALEAEQLASLERTGTYGPYEKEYIRRDGSRVPVLLNGSLIQGRDGESFIWSVVHDMSEQKKAEAKIHDALLSAEEANQAKSEFLASMSHELRTPLNAVLGYGQLLQLNLEKNLTPDQEEYLNHIISGGNHLLKLVNDVLDLARIEADRMPIALEDVSAQEIVKECLVHLQIAAKQKNVSIINQLDGQTYPPVHSDRLRYRQIVINLISNAIRYNKEGGTITLSCTEIENGFLRLSVTDTGIGIAESDRNNLFTLFSHLPSDPHIAQGGIGIGLAVSKMLAERLGGHIGFDSQHGEGSTFWIDLPLPTNENVMFWTDDLRIGIDAIDRDHQIILVMINNIWLRPTKDEKALEQLSEFAVFATHHFARKETVMESMGLEKHIDEHRAFEQTLKALNQSFSANPSPEKLKEIGQFLHDWWSDKILSGKHSLVSLPEEKKSELEKQLHELA